MFNPLPFPDPGSRIFSASSPEAKAAVVALLAEHDVMEKLRTPSASIGMVATDPERSARDAVAFVESRGFQATVVMDAEPDLPIAFVVTDAMVGTVFNFRRHVIHLPRPQPA
ncbi:MAG: hypothetical protein NDJ94_17835 [Vicinamibacteria bacterium]|jgi:hypothetical protein|nr:hypothetical protein [Vicinamibacteria bacterium]